MKRVRLGELSAATSLFTDLGTGQPVDHGLRTCLVSVRLADVMDLGLETRREVFFVALLRFLGCTADSYQMAGLFDDDDLGVLSGMADVTMGSPWEELAGLARTAAGTVGFPGSLRTLASALLDTRGKERLLEAHCEVASRLADDMGLPSNVSAALDKGYARWDGRGVPRGLGGDDVPMSIRVSVVARDLELWGRQLGPTKAGEVLMKRRGRAYDPAVVDAALGMGIERLRRCDDDLWEVVVGLEPSPRIFVTGPEGVRRALRALGDFADLKVPAFTGHSRRVERVVVAAARSRGLDSSETEQLACAASVHDLGVVATPTRVWRRADMSPADLEQARLHPMWSERLLKRVGGLEMIAGLAGRHHERSDGTGYPSGLSGDLGRSAGLLACVELYDETARRGRDTDDVAEEMRSLGASRSLNATDVAAVLTAVGAGRSLIEVERPGGLTEREIDVLRLVARGETNRQIAGLLRISAKTVGSHVEHIYAKTQVRSRAAATLFAVRHGLID